MSGDLKSSHELKKTHLVPRRRCDSDYDRRLMIFSVRGLPLLGDEVMTKICVAKGQGLGKREPGSPYD